MELAERGEITFGDGPQHADQLVAAPGERLAQQVLLVSKNR